MTRRREQRMRNESSEQAASEGESTEAPRFVQYLFFKADPAWRRLPEEERERGKREFARVIEQAAGVKTFAYSTLGLKADTDLMLWRIADSLEELQDMTSLLL